jgi:signal transduction histidine kinase
LCTGLRKSTRSADPRSRFKRRFRYAAQAYFAVMTTTSQATAQRERSRWILAHVWLAGIGAYCLAIPFLEPRPLLWVNDIAWTVASAAAAVVCWWTARRVESNRRRAWLAMAIGCTSWFIGQIHWNYSQLVLGIELPYPSVGQIFYSAFPVFSIAAVLQLPESRDPMPFTFRHVGNIGLVTCCLAVTILIGILEPALQSGLPDLHLIIALIHTLLVTAAFLTALYALWTYHWGSSWTPMLLLVIGMGVYAVTNLLYAHSLLTQSYLPSDLLNASWLLMFGIIAVAAREQAWLSGRRRTEPPESIVMRERWLEAVVPALLIIIMVLVVVGSSSALTARVMPWAAGLFILFALLLGAREAWIQYEAQHLTEELVRTNEQLKAANDELRLSEARYRELNAALEQRVSERTTELKRAYDELEGFSYAVAHDLKAPLRAINGFAHLFEVELNAQLNDRAREYLTRIRNGSVRMATLIDDLLSYSHADRRGLQTSVVKLPVLIESVVAQYADEVQKRRIHLTIEAQPIKLRVDAEGLLLALRNLFENAIKYTRERSQPSIAIRARAHETGVLVSVEDNGIGFDMQYHDHIFKIFQRLHRDDQYPGTGIGLALVRKALERIGGRVWAESKPGEGATFYIELPQALVI